ncbi:MAG: hypothetical protein OEY19_03345, partial [Gammaproteobacteria bacterium]|nr:hypothetical protein [Gammaproteobacteria bacterium]
DLNGDQKRDWVGIVVKDGRFSLMAYLSNPSNQYKVQTLMDYSYFPENTHINYMSTHELYLLTKNKSLKALAKYALVVNDIGKPSQVYVWDSEKLLHVHTFEGYFRY